MTEHRHPFDKPQSMETQASPAPTETPEEKAVREANEELEKAKKEAAEKIAKAEAEADKKKAVAAAKAAEEKAKRKEAFDKKHDEDKKKQDEEDEKRREEIGFEMGAILKDHGGMRSSIPLTSNFWNLQNELAILSAK